MKTRILVAFLMAVIAVLAASNYSSQQKLTIKTREQLQAEQADREFNKNLESAIATIDEVLAKIERERTNRKTD